MRTLLILGAIAVIGLAGAAIFIWSGVYNVAATAQHTAPVYWLLEIAMRRAVVNRARDIRVPDLTGADVRARGIELYRGNCVPCHGAPGIAPEPFALGMMPVPANLALTARQWSAAELFWVVQHGVKTTGMPAWAYRMPEADLWAVVAFLTTLPTLSPADYAELAARAVSATAGMRDAAPAAEVAPLSFEASPAEAVQRGKTALQQYACVTCHVIPDVVGAHMTVGPPLTGIANRKYLAGVLPNSPDNMVRWLRAPQRIAPGSAMPDLGVTERDAHDIAAFLGTLR
jgi:mono/diheme cytochrome c family protein